MGVVIYLVTFFMAGGYEKADSHSVEFSSGRNFHNKKFLMRNILFKFTATLSNLNTKFPILLENLTS